MLEWEKYLLPEIKIFWEREERYAAWLLVELKILDAKEKLKLIPRGIAIRTEEAAKFTVREIDEEDKARDQEMVSFSAVVKKYLPAELRPYWHAGVTSYDIWEPARALQIKRSLALARAAMVELIKTMREMAKTYKYNAEIGRTHLVQAEPITFGLKILNWVDELTRALRDLDKAKIGVISGKISGAVGNYANIDPRIEPMVCRRLGITPAKISTQILSRDRHYRFIAALAAIDNSLERFATIIRLLQQTEVGEVEEPFSEGGGSSAMPHKRNPNKSERICSLARLVRSFVTVAGENQSLQLHERTLDESANERFTIPLSIMLTYYNLRLLNEIMTGLRVDTDRMLENMALTKGVIFSEDVMLALAKKGMGREEARMLVQKIAQITWQKREDFAANLKADLKVKALLSDGEIEKCLKPEHYLRNIDPIFARFGL
jgi:adenylosuccinate lyase